MAATSNALPLPTGRYCPFLSLPSELRLQIYENLTNLDGAKLLFLAYQGIGPPERICHSASPSIVPLVRACRQTRREVLHLVPNRIIVQNVLRCTWFTGIQPRRPKISPSFAIWDTYSFAFPPATRDCGTVQRSRGCTAPSEQSASR